MSKTIERLDIFEQIRIREKALEQAIKLSTCHTLYQSRDIVTIAEALVQYVTEGPAAITK